MSKYRLFFEELFVKKSPIEILKEINNNISMEDILFENFHENKDWFIYEGENKIVVIFPDNSKQSFKIHFHKNRLQKDKETHRNKAARTWKKLATEIRKNTDLNEAGNPVTISWQECFKNALNHPEMKEFIDDGSTSFIFESSDINQLEEEMIKELSFNDLLRSMGRYRTARDKRLGTRTGSESRLRASKDVKSKSLKVISTVGKDGKERETSLFSYKSYHGNDDTRSRFNRPRWQGYIKFLDGFNEGKDGDIEINCNCPDYKYVWAKANKDHDAGVTSVDNKLDVQAGFHGGGNENNDTYGKRIRNPDNVPGLCKHLIALSEYLNTATSPVAPVDKNKKDISPVAKMKPKKPINIFERMKQFALSNPQFDVPYED